MKVIIKITLFLLLSVTFYSCTTYQKITVYGKPGSEIYTPDNNRVGTIQSNGKTKVTLPRDGYYAYLLSHEAGSNELVPFALDYKNKSYSGTRALAGLGYTVVAASIVCDIVGLAAVIGKDEDVGAPFLIGGLSGGLVGAILSGVPESRLNETQREYQFKYLSNHKTNYDLQITEFVDNGYSKSVGNGFVTTSAPTASLVREPTTTSQSTSSARSRTSKSKKTLKDFGKQIAGTYVGTGKLLEKDNVVESYNDIKVVVKRQSNNSVEVEVFESNGDAFFNNASIYRVNKKNDAFNLSLNGIPSAIITIDADTDMIYYHPKVNIDGVIYTLEISAKKND